MKKSSIKLKVTLWYTITISILLISILLLGIYYLNQSELLKSKKELQKIVLGVAESIAEEANEEDDEEDEEADIINENVDLDLDFEFYGEGVIFSVYDENENLIYGKIPAEFPENIKFQNQKIQNLDQLNQNWLVYDVICIISGNQNLWIRGIMSTQEIYNLIHMMLILAAILFPIFIFIVAFVGYHMIKRALKPVEEIQRETEMISSGADLSRRLEESSVKNEISGLLSTINDMFERLETAFESEKQFAADASHELKTPIAVIISRCEYSLKSEKLTDTEKEDLQIILKQAKKMSTIISQLLFISKMEHNNSHFEFEAVDLSIMLEFIAQESEERANKKSIKIKVFAEENCMINGEQTLLMRLWMNLIDNAINYGKENGHIYTGVKKCGDKIIGWVEDDGIGIEKQYLDKIWNRFYQVRYQGKELQEGCGLGLFMVKWIISLHHGTIEVRSEIGKGTVFTFKLPQ